MVCGGSYSFGQQTYTYEVATKDSTEAAILNSTNYQRTHTELLKLQETHQQLREGLYQLGYFEHELAPLVKQNDSLFTTKLESLGSKYDRIKMVIPAELRPTGFEQSDTLEIQTKDLERTMNTFLGQLETEGKLFATLQLTNIEKLPTGLVGTLVLTDNRPRTIDEIIIQGYDKFPKSLLRYGTKIRKGLPLNRRFINKEAAVLASLPYLQQIKNPEILFEKDSSRVFLYFEKTKSNYFDGFVGFNTEEGTGNLKLNGYLDLQLINNLNAGEAFELRWKNDGREQTSFNLNAQIPFLFKSPVGFEANLNIFRKDSSFLSTSLDGKISYLVSTRSRITGGIGIIESNATDETLTDTQDFNSTFFTAGFNYIEPDEVNTLFRTRSVLKLDAAVGNRSSALTSTSQWRVALTANRNFQLNPRNYIYVNASGAFLNSPDYFDNEKFRIGGINSIRGFNENILEATLYSYLNTEYRFLLAPNTYAHSIIDIAFLQDDLTQLETTLYGIGFGLGLQTNSGIFKLNYAVGATEDSSFRLSDSNVHISFSSNF